MALRASRRCLLSSYSRMLDMGGMPQGSSGPIRPVDASKNSKLRAIAFDFELLTRSVEKSYAGERDNVSAPTNRQPKVASTVTPDVGMVQNIANLLNVSLDGSSSKKDDEFRDDLSGLVGDSSRSTRHPDEKPSRSLSTRKRVDIRDETHSAKDSVAPHLSGDIRAKYASKLRGKLEGGLSGLTSAKEQQEEALTRGDAAGGHFTARAIAASTSTSQKKWLALSGTGHMLTYISTRSIKVVLLPIPRNQKHQAEGERMEDFKSQLSNQVTVDLLVKRGGSVQDALDSIMDGLKVPPSVTMVVSDRDDYLKAAKELGMITCRIRPANARRGNVTAHYNVPELSDVQEVVNEINGISFNAVFSAGKL